MVNRLLVPEKRSDFLLTTKKVYDFRWIFVPEVQKVDVDRGLGNSARLGSWTRDRQQTYYCRSASTGVGEGLDLVQCR